MNRDIQDIFQPLRSDGIETVTFPMVVRRIDAADAADHLNLTPDYQRDYVWSDRQAEQFVGHMIEGGQVAPVIVQRYPIQRGGVTSDEVIDGQQRLRSVYRWMKGEIAAELHDGSTVRIDDLDAESQRVIRSSGWLTGPHFSIQYVSLPRAERLRLYLRLNRGGTVHTDAEIGRVRAMLAEEMARLQPSVTP